MFMTTSEKPFCSNAALLVVSPIPRYTLYAITHNSAKSHGLFRAISGKVDCVLVDESR